MREERERKNEPRKKHQAGMYHVDEAEPLYKRENRMNCIQDLKK